MFTRTLSRSTSVLNTLVRKQNLINSKFVNVNSKLNDFIPTCTRTYSNCGSPKATILIANGFEEIEAAVTLELLRRASIDVTLTGLTEGIITGLNKLKVTPDQTFGECTTKNPIDALILTGGNCAVEAMKKNEDVIKLIKKQEESCKIVAAICTAPLLLKHACVFPKKCLTSHPSIKEELVKDFTYKEEDVVIDGKLITSRGPGTAHLFALTMIVELVGAQKAKQVAEACLYPHS
ncbi:protein dj-1beta-like [Chrysoperla carnea]|uniref:protein dj-1beta-like n=1 Tax=Chrysoperla carnea TaxID=189513 RepID=UPI001D05CA7A|nr:protein dj-1beta-like [Chrysoperla carnea]